MKREGKLTEIAARDIVTTPSSSDRLRRNLKAGLFASQFLMNLVSRKTHCKTKASFSEEPFSLLGRKDTASRTC